MYALFRPLLLVLCATLLTGCYTRARRLEVSAVSAVQVGTTTTAEVEKQFGRPNETIVGSNGKTVARYFFRELHLSKHVGRKERRDHPGDILFRTLTLLSGPGPVIRQKVHDESHTPIVRHNSDYITGPSMGPEYLVSIHKGQTTKAEVIESFGEPTSRTLAPDGTEVLIWIRSRARWLSLHNVEVHQLIVSLDEQQRVDDFAVVSHDILSVSGSH